MSNIEDGIPVLKEHGGKFERWELDAYLGFYETIANLFTNGLIRDDMLYTNFSYNLVKASRNPEIFSYVESLQEKDSELFAGFQDMALALEAI